MAFKITTDSKIDLFKYYDKYCKEEGVQKFRLYRPRNRKSCFRIYASSKGSDQTAHPRSLISAFAVR